MLMAKNPNIRWALPKDAPAIQEVARESWHEAYGDVLGNNRVEKAVSSWYDPEKVISDDIEPVDRPIFIAETDLDVVGFTEAVPDDENTGLAHLYRIYVKPDYWGNGVGSSLLKQTELELQNRGFEQLQLTVMAKNEVGVGFYESRGFERIATEQNKQLDIQEYRYQKRI